MTQTARIGVVVAVAVAGAALAFVAWFARPTAPSAPSDTPVATAVSNAANAANAARNVDESVPVTPPAPVARRVVSEPPPGSSQPPRDADTLVVRVVDFDGQPIAGVPVSIRLSAIDLRRRRVEALATTAGVDGECVVPQFARHVASIGVLPAERSNVVELLAHGPGWESSGVFVDATQLPAAPIVLRAPPHGSVRVRLRDPSRVPAQQVVQATLEVHPLSGDPDARAWRRRVEPMSAGTREFVFARVELQTQVRVGVMSLVAFGPDAMHLDVVDVAGPVRHGQVVDVVLDVPAGTVRVTGRVVGDLLSVSDEPVTALLVASGMMGALTLHPAANGHFDLLLPAAMAGRRLRQVSVMKSIRGVPHGAARDVDVLLTADAPIDVGELRLVRNGALRRTRPDLPTSNDEQALPR